MDPELERRIDVALLLLAVIAGSTAVAAASVADAATVAAAIIAAVLAVFLPLFVLSQPNWVRET